MEMSVTQFKAKCLGVIGKVQRERCRVTILKHGRSAAELIPVDERHAQPLWGRAAKETVIKGNLIETNERWHADD